jgi:hypothetical protein
MDKNNKLLEELDNVLAYSWVLGWYTGRDGVLNDIEKINATKKAKEEHPLIVKACEDYESLKIKSDLCDELKKALNDEVQGQECLWKWEAIYWQTECGERSTNFAAGACPYCNKNLTQERTVHPLLVREEPSDEQR